MEATELTLQLVSAYPQRDGVPDPEGYVSAIAATLARFPVAAARRCCSIQRGLPARLKHRPAPADVVEFCEAEVKRIRELRGAATWMLEERERREKAAAERLSPEQREANLARVDKILKGFKGGK